MGCTDRQNRGLGPIDGDGLRLRVYSSQSFLLSLRGRKAPSFTTNTPPSPGSQGKAKVEGGVGGVGGFDLLANATTPTQSMQDRQIHVIFEGPRPWGHARGLQRVPLSSQPPRSRQKGAPSPRRPRRLLWLSQHLRRSPCLPPIHPPSFSSSSPPSTPYSQPPVSSLLPAPLVALGVRSPASRGVGRKQSKGTATGDSPSPQKPPPTPDTQPQTHNPYEPPSCSCLLVGSDTARPGVCSTYCRPPPPDH